MYILTWWTPYFSSHYSKDFLLGICVDVTLSTVKLYKLRANNYIEFDDILLNGRAIGMARNTKEVSLYWFPSSEQVVVSKRSYVRGNTPGDAYSNDYLSNIYARFARIFYKAKETAFNLTSSDCEKANVVGKNHHCVLHSPNIPISMSYLQATTFYTQSKTI